MEIIGAITYRGDNIPLFVRDGQTFLCVDSLKRAFGDVVSSSYEHVVHGHAYSLATATHVIDNIKTFYPSISDRITEAGDESCIIELTKLTIHGIHFSVYVNIKTGVVYLSYKDLPRSAKLVTRYLLLLTNGVIGARIHVCEAQYVLEACPTFYTYIHHGAVMAAAAERKNFGAFTPVAMQTGKTVNTEGISVAVMWTHSQTYLGSSGVILITKMLKNKREINADRCMIVKSNDDYHAVVEAESFIEWYGLVEHPDIVQKFIKNVNVPVGVDVPVDVPVKTQPVLQHHAVIGLAEQWVRDHPVGEKTSCEYQREFLRECSEAYAVLGANKTSFRITYS